MDACRTLVVAALACAAPLATTAAGEDQPRRKSGTWEIAVTTAGQPSAFVSQVCIDANADDLARSAGTSVQQSDCSEASITRDGDRFLVRSVCPMRNSTVTTEAVLTGDFDSAYRGQIQARYSPPLYGRSEVGSSVEAKWTGPCP